MSEGIFFLEGIFSLTSISGQHEKTENNYLFICGSFTNNKILSQQKDLISAANNFKMTLNEVQMGLNLASYQVMDILQY